MNSFISDFSLTFTTRTDLEYALHQGSATRFSIAHIIASRPTTYKLPNNSGREDEDQTILSLNHRLLTHLSADLRILLIDITELSRLVNDASVTARPKLCGFPFHDNVLLFGYRLISYSPLGGPRPSSHLENIVHLGLTAFVVTFLRGFDRQLLKLPILAELIRTATQQHYDAQQGQELLLWTLFIGAASVFKQSDDAWLKPKTRQTMHNLGLQKWEDVNVILIQFPWINAVHDEAAQKLWHSLS
jgi:hypothetical protein